MKRAQAGFTLIELMIVAAIVSIVASIAVPNLLSSRAVANERAAVASLKTVLGAQSLCQGRAVADRDYDGRGEAIALDQLAGLRTLPGTAQTITPPFLPQSLGTIDANGISRSRGYLMALYLPDASGAGVLASAANEGSIDVEAAEIAWSCIAWPMTRGRTGSATYFVNQAGEILMSRDAAYDGPTTVPPAGAALLVASPDQILGGALAIDAVGADGNTWRPQR